MTRTLANNISRIPVIFDSEQAKATLSRLPDDVTRDALGALVEAVASCSPFLSGLLISQSAWLTEVLDRPSEEVIPDLVVRLKHNMEHSRPDWVAFQSQLRITKARAALFSALCDLGGLWNLADVTENLTLLADGLTGCALRYCLAEEIASGKVPGRAKNSNPETAGLFVIAMGKMGARELNYSSDIDLICLFDQTKFTSSDTPEVRARFLSVVRKAIRALSAVTADGYVFRTDLRLRPNPSVTPVCMSVAAAEHYYTTIGRTWERAAYIKARVSAGDLDAGGRFLHRLQPFIWRDPLDFAAVEDIEKILQKIRSKKGKFSPSALPGYDIKLGPGGIREIELFAQTRQLIMGGRLPVLRDPTTLGALAAFRDEAIIDTATCDSQSQAYMDFRRIEHRLQMIHDRQSQILPSDEEERARVAALDGFAERQVWEQMIISHLKAVYDVTQSFFSPNPRKPEKISLKKDQMTAFGFRDPEKASALVARWRNDELEATTPDRATQLYRELEADLVKRLGNTEHPDLALAGFDRFLTTVKNPVQTLSMLRAHPELLDTVRHVFTSAPRLANLLGTWPETLDAVLAPDYFDPLPTQDWLEADLHIRIGERDDYEHILDVTRVWARETRLRVALHLLSGRANGSEAGKAFSTIANCVLSQLLATVAEYSARQKVEVPGRGIAVIAFGNFGTQDMTDQSDLDLVTVYDMPPSVETKDASARFFGRLTRALIAALSVRTAQGGLYNIDMRMRPSGKRGPVAVSLPAFEQHQLHTAAVWEHLALMRARVICGEPRLVTDIETIIKTALKTRIRDASVYEDARVMRRRLVQMHRNIRQDPWSLKHTAGGIMEIELLAQTGGLIAGQGFNLPAQDLLSLLGQMGWVSIEDADTLSQALTMQNRLLQLHSIALSRTHRICEAGNQIQSLMAQATGDADFSAVEERLRSVQNQAAKTCAKFFQDNPTDYAT